MQIILELTFPFRRTGTNITHVNFVLFEMIISTGLTQQMFIANNIELFSLLAKNMQSLAVSRMKYNSMLYVFIHICDLIKVHAQDTKHQTRKTTLTNQNGIIYRQFIIYQIPTCLNNNTVTSKKYKSKGKIEQKLVVLCNQVSWFLAQQGASTSSLHNQWQ